MTQEEKDLLLKDLCARLPYGVRMKGVNEDFELSTNTYPKRLSYTLISADFKPYLRPLSSMTDEEYEAFPIPYSFDSFSTWNNTISSEVIEGTQILIGIDEIAEIIDWLKSHHFDYRGLIEKGLALEAPEDMYKMETQELTEKLSKQELTQKLDAIKSDIQWLYTPNKPLCKKPSQKKLKEKFGFDRLDNLRHDIFKGSHMRTYSFGADENVWTFPDGVEEKIEDDKDYKVWYTWHDASDPADMSTYHHVYYIEEVSAGKMAVLQFLKHLINEID